MKNGGVATLASNIIRVQPFANAENADIVEFDLTQQSDYDFLSELVAVQQLLEASSAQANSEVRTNSPDLLTLTLVGLSVSELVSSLSPPPPKKKGKK